MIARNPPADGMGSNIERENSPRCDGCRHWTRDSDYKNRTDETDEEYALRPVVGECLKPKPFWETTEWSPSGPKQPYEVHRTTKPEFVGLKMFVQDGSDYVAHLLTAPDFYCAHFDSKPVPDGE